MNKYFLLIAGLFAHTAVMAQQTDPGLENAVQAAVSNSKSVATAQSGIERSQMEYQSVKEARLPDISASGQFMYLPIKPTVNLKFQQANSEETNNEATTSNAMPIPKTVAFGSLTASLPLFTGFQLKNNLILSDQKLEASKITLAMQKEVAALQAIQLYTAIYKVQETIDLLDQNLIQSETRIKDFTNFVENGLLAENDLLKAKLQYSNIELSKEDAKNQLANLNYRLNILTGQNIRKTWNAESLHFTSYKLALEHADYSARKDLAFYRKSNEMAQTGIELSKGNYYPSIALSAGYIGANIGSLASVTNAVNFGIGLKYNISSLYKNQTEVKVAQLKLIEAERKLDEAKDKASIEVYEAQNQYRLAAKKVEVYKQAVAQAKENLRITTNKYDNGLEDTDHLLEADIQYLQAEINEKTAKADQLMAWFQISYASGNLLEYFNIK